MMQMHPYILNINEDAQLSGVVKLFIQEGEAVCISLSLSLSDECPTPSFTLPLRVRCMGSDRPIFWLVLFLVSFLLFCVAGEWDIGLSDSSPRSISIKGLG